MHTISKPSSSNDSGALSKHSIQTISKHAQQFISGVFAFGRQSRHIMVKHCEQCNSGFLGMQSRQTMSKHSEQCIIGCLHFGRQSTHITLKHSEQFIIGLFGRQSKHTVTWHSEQNISGLLLIQLIRTEVSHSLHEHKGDEMSKHPGHIYSSQASQHCAHSSMASSAAKAI